MVKSDALWWRESRGLAFLIICQVLFCVFFVFDVATDFAEGDTDVLHMVPELLATIGLVIGILVEIRVLMALLRKQENMSQGLSAASGALAEVIEGYFTKWNLTPAEHDVALFAIKGYSISEISEFRGSAEGTIKTHLHAIYRKAGVAGQPQLVSLLVEDLLQAPLVKVSGGTP
jgi:DNA-binding CsgD family transcriptional regulator